ncbi:MAG: hypothetical protein AABZ62_06090, partial [Planctomycetota bacterium]
HKGHNAVFTELSCHMINQEGIEGVHDQIKDMIGQRLNPECGIKELVGVTGQRPPVEVLAKKGMYVVLTGCYGI